VSHPTTRRPLRSLLLVAIALGVLFAPTRAIVAQAPLPGDATPPSPVETPTPADAAAVEDPFFGIVQAVHDPERAVEAGVTWERVVVWWSAFQPNGPEDWDASAWPTRRRAEEQRARGIEMVGVVLHTPPWAAREGGDPAVSPPHNLELPWDDPQNHWGRFMTRLAREYAGAIDTWIIWNEPEFCWTGTVAEFATLQKVAYQAIKVANPNATVVLTGTTYWMDHEAGRVLFLERLLDTLSRDPDVVGPPDAEEGAEGAEGDLPAPTPTAGEGQDPEEAEEAEEPHSHFFDAVAVHQYGNPLNAYAVPILYRRILASYGLDKPLWLPESNIVPHDDPLKTLHRGGLRATMEEQAAYMIQSAALARAAGVSRYAVYKMRDEEPENDQFYGLVRNDGTPRPAYAAYRTAIREMRGARDATYFWSGSATPPSADEITALLASTRNRAQFVWPGALNGVRMARGADRVTVLWNATAAPLAVGVPSSAPTATLIDKYGEATPVARALDGAFHLTLAPASNNTDARDPSLVLVGGDPVILVEPGAADAPDPYPRPIDACWGVPGALAPAPNESAEDGAGGEGAEAASDDVWVAPATGYAVGGPWLAFYEASGGLDVLGYPRSPVVADPLDDTQCVQFFQRAVLEWHPENPPEYRIQRRLLGERLGEAAAPAPQEAPNGPGYWYFPFGERGLGHAVSDRAPDGTEIGFKAFYDRYGGENTFGYPMEPPARRTGADGVERWTQRFQAALFEHHAEYDIDGAQPESGLPWRTWRVQLRLLGDEYLRDERLPFVSGDPAQHLARPPQPTP
jgi:hypothetical protein